MSDSAIAAVLASAKELVNSHHPQVLACGTDSLREHRRLQDALRAAINAHEEDADPERLARAARDVAESPHPRIIACVPESKAEWLRLKKQLLDDLDAYEATLG